MQLLCAECGKKLPAPRGDPMNVPEGAVRVRLVRHATGQMEVWGTTERTLAPNILVCDLCLRLPRHGEVVAGNPQRLGVSLRSLPVGAVYGWPYYASCYLAPERIFKARMLQAWTALQQKQDFARELERRFSLLDRLFALWTRWRGR